MVLSCPYNLYNIDDDTASTELHLAQTRHDLKRVPIFKPRTSECWMRFWPQYTENLAIDDVVDLQDAVIYAMWLESVVR